MSSEQGLVSIRSEAVIQRELWGLCFGPVFATNVMGSFGQVSGPFESSTVLSVYRGYDRHPLLKWSSVPNMETTLDHIPGLSYELVGEAGPRAPEPPVFWG